MSTKPLKRARLSLNRPNQEEEDITDIFDSGFSRRSIHNISEIWAFVATIVALLLFYLIAWNIRSNLPTALTSSNLLHTDNTFIAERAWKDLKVLTNFGPRTAGSYSNEVLAVDFLKREIAHIKQSAHKNQRIELDVQAVSGSFFRDTGAFSSTSVYRKVQNIVVKLHGNPNIIHNEQVNNNSVLINCHFDSAPGSPGASDDAANCVVMLEILRVLSSVPERNEFSIIFLFNGAEETGLQASHGFITKHKWAREIKAFINLESVGSNGKEMLFQGTPNSACLINAYADAVPYPSAQVAAEEIFHSGIIPSDTDLRIFRDMGNLTGLDFAYFINGHHYHTKFDHIKYLSMESIQHTGSNILSIIKNLANNKCLLHIHEPQEKNVFFDVFGKYFINYSITTAKTLNIGVAIGAILIPYILLLRTTKGVHKKYIYSEIFLGFLAKLISLIVILLSVYAIATDLDSNADKPMIWYAHPFICIPTYCLITVLLQLVIEEKLKRKNTSALSLALRIQARLIGVCLFWSITLLIFTFYGIRTAYFLLVPQVVVLFCHLVIAALKLQNTRSKWLIVHAVGQVMVFCWTMNFYHMISDVIIATTGRSGGLRNPELIVGAIAAVLTFCGTSFITTFSGLIKSCKHYTISLLIIYGITRYYFISHTGFGFAYEKEIEGQRPRVQRHLITHTMRTLFDKEGKIRYTDSGYWMTEFDRNALKTIESLAMPEKPEPSEKNILCKSEVLCGLPLYSARQLLVNAYWVPGSKPAMSDVSHLSLILKEQLAEDKYRMKLILTGSHKVSLQIRVKEGVILENWNLLEYVPKKTVYKNQAFYFVEITHGLVEDFLNITLDLKLLDKLDSKRSLVDITLTTLHLDYAKEHTTEFNNMLNRLPEWAYAVPIVADLKSWTF